MVAGRPGIPGSRGRRGVPGVPGKPGYFKMCYVNLRHKIVESILLPKVEKYRYTIHNGKMHVDLDEGRYERIWRFSLLICYFRRNKLKDYQVNCDNFIVSGHCSSKGESHSAVVCLLNQNLCNGKLAKCK